MRKWGSILQVCFTYVGTVVGAGFATGQEILQFFTRYGSLATYAILLATGLFLWLGTKLMILSGQIGARSYEDMNRLLFGQKIGNVVSLLTLLALFAVGAVMLAGAGSVFAEHLHVPYQLGLLGTMALTYFFLTRGMDGLMAVNSFVVPLMIFFSGVVVFNAASAPGAANWLEMSSTQPAWRIWFSPLLYTAFNLTLAQSVLVPLGAKIQDRSILLWGGALGGLCIGVMLLAGHFALSARMPDILQFEIPMGHMIQGIGGVLPFLFLLVIFGEIFTTLLADIYGLSLQVEQRFRVPYGLVAPVTLALCYAVSQFGFKTLLSTLYPLLGMLSVAWLSLLVARRGV